MIGALSGLSAGKARFSAALFLLVPIFNRKFYQSTCKMASSPKPVIVEATEGRHSATIIFLHGLGDTGHGWADAIAAIKPPYVKLVCPTAPSIPVALNLGMTMPAWFDLYSLNPNGREDTEGMKRSADAIANLIEQEISEFGIPADRILIGGFSMGGALALHVALRYPKTLAGVLAFSCWLPSHKEYPSAFNSNNRYLKIFQCHGDSDQLVPMEWGSRTADILKPLVQRFNFKSYAGVGHSSCSEQMRDAADFIGSVLRLQ